MSGSLLALGAAAAGTSWSWLGLSSPGPGQRSDGKSPSSPAAAPAHVASPDWSGLASSELDTTQKSQPPALAPPSIGLKRDATEVPQSKLDESALARLLASWPISNVVCCLLMPLAAIIALISIVRRFPAGPEASAGQPDRAAAVLAQNWRRLIKLGLFICKRWNCSACLRLEAELANRPDDSSWLSEILI